MGVRPLILSVVAAGLVAGCVLIEREPRAPRVSNAADEPVQIAIVRQGEATALSTIASGVTVDLNAFEGVCTDGELVATSLSGAEIDRRSDPLCPDEVWTVEP